MIGLLFFGAVILWMGVAIYLAIRLPRWFNFKARWGCAIAPMVFFIPVIDEVIALPQAYLLCQQAEDDFWYDPSIKGGVLNYSSRTLSRVDEKVGINIRARLVRRAYILKSSGMPAIKSTSVEFSAGLLFTTLWGANGYPVIIPESCPNRHLATTRFQSIIRLLELSSESNPVIYQ